MSALLAPAVPGYVLRSYQQNAVNRSVEFLTNPRLRGRNGLLVIPTGAGKSLVIAGIAARLDAPVLVFQPSKEILQQNAEKLRGYGYAPAIWSASLNRKRVGQITLATIGSVMNHVEAFKHFKYVLIDEAHLVNPKGGMCFGTGVAGDVTERNHRFLEEALELVQTGGCTASEAHQLVDYVYGRPVGVPSQEAGGVLLTLAALCMARAIDMQQAGEDELRRVWTKIDLIRRKQAEKPKHSPLPASPQAETKGDE